LRNPVLDMVYDRRTRRDLGLAVPAIRWEVVVETWDKMAGVLSDTDLLNL